MLVQIAGLVLSAFGAYSAVQAQNIQAKTQAKVAKRNAVVAEQDAAFAREAAAKREDAHRLKVARFRSSQKVKMAFSGFVVGAGSFGDVLEDTAMMGELDALAIRQEGEIEAWRSNVRAANFSTQGSVYDAAYTSPYLASGGSLLTGLDKAGAFDKWTD